MEELQEVPNNKPQTSPDRPKIENDPTTPESKSRYLAWLREKRGLLLKTTSAVIPAAVLALAIIHGCDDAESPANTTPTPTGPTATETFIPEPTATQVVEITPTPTQETPTPQPTETPAPSETAQPTVNIYEQITQNIQNSELSQEEKSQTEQLLSQLRQIEETRNQFINAYKQDVSENGEPLLLTLIKQKYSKINPSDLSGFDPSNPNAAYENQIFFLAHENYWQNNVAPILEGLSNSTNGNEINQKIQEINNQMQEQRIYLETDTKTGTNVEVQVNFVPQNEEQNQKLQETLAKIEELKVKMPLFGNYQITVKNEGDGASAYDVEGDLESVEVSIQRQEDIAHELGHSLVVDNYPYFEGDSQNSVKNNVRFLRYHTPQQVVEIMKNELKLLNNETLGKHYPAQTENPTIILAKPQLNSHDLGELATWAATVNYDKAYRFPLKERVERADIEHLAELLGRYYEERGRIISDSAIDILDYNRQLLGTTI